MACRIVAENGSFGLADRPYADWWGKDLPNYAEAARKKLLGQDACKVEELHDRLGGPLQNLTDRALWDLVARDAGKPLHAVFGTNREKIPAYFSKGISTVSHRRSAAIASGRSMPGRRSSTSSPRIMAGNRCPIMHP